jgi:hypothetical protein
MNIHEYGLYGYTLTVGFVRTTALLLFLVCLLFSQRAFAQCPPTSPTITISGASSVDYTLNAGDVMHITPTGDYSGAVTLSGGALYNCSDLTQATWFGTTTLTPQPIARSTHRRSLGQ